MSSAGRDDLVAGDFEVEQHHLLLAQRADPEHGLCHLVVSAPSEYLHRGRRLIRRNLGAGLVIVEWLAPSTLQGPTRTQHLDAEEPE